MTEQEAWVRFAAAHLRHHGHSSSAVKEADYLRTEMRARFPAPVEREADEATAAQLDSALAVIADLVTGARTIDQAREWLDDHHFSRPVAVRVDPLAAPEWWRDHTPGDPMPVEPSQLVQVREGPETDVIATIKAQHVDWGNDRPDATAFQWKPVQFGELPPDHDHLQDKIDGLECDLDGALEKLAAVCNGKPLDGAAEWLRLNYPGHRATLSLSTPTEPDWIDHTPGDPCPCEPGQEIYYRHRSGRVIGPCPASCCLWCTEPKHECQTVAWKPAQ